MGAGWAEGKKGPTTLQGAFFGRAPTAQKINGRVGGTAQGGRSPRALRGLALRRAAGEQPTFAPQGLRSIYARPWAACAPHRRPKGGRLRRRPRPPEQGAQRPKWWAGLPTARKGRRRAATPAQGGKGVRGERACRAAARGPPSCAELAGDYAKRTRKNPEPFGPGSFPLVQLAPPRRNAFIIPHRLRFVKPACRRAGPPAAASAGPRATPPPPRGRAGGGGFLLSVRCLLAAAIAGRPAPGVRPAAFAVCQKMKICP